MGNLASIPKTLASPVPYQPNKNIPASDSPTNNLIMVMIEIDQKIDSFQRALITLLDQGDNVILGFSGGKVQAV
jgi:hypothetical protein